MCRYHQKNIEFMSTLIKPKSLKISKLRRYAFVKNHLLKGNLFLVYEDLLLVFGAVAF